jgi:spore photoproduct lyase
VYYVKDRTGIQAEHLNKRTLYISRPAGKTAGRCPGSKGHICCNYLTVDLYMGCTLGCSYCIMDSYLNFSPVTVNAAPEKSLDELRKIISLNPDRVLRIGTGETGDSLQFDPLFKMSSLFLEELAEYSNVYFELKTKTDFIQQLPDIKNRENAVLAFSLNPSSIARAEEKYAVSLEARLKAAAEGAERGYSLAFHFDPVFLTEGWKERYQSVLDQLEPFSRYRVLWISLGTFRYPPALKNVMPPRPWLYSDFSLCRDGKYRYLQKYRAEAYRFMKNGIEEKIETKIYMCMESPAMWSNVFGQLPVGLKNYDFLFKKAVLSRKKL